MRASTLFGITIAGLLGLGVVVGAKYAGLFDPKQTVADPPPPQVLVAKENLFEGTTTAASQVFVRPLTKDEVGWYGQNKDKLLPAMPNAAHMRVLAKSVKAGEILRQDHFEDLNLPTNLSARLGKDMRAVNVVLHKEKAAGGLIMKDEYVDVYLTTIVCADSACTTSSTLTAPIARNVKVIAKRNNLWTVMQPVDPNAPVHYTLAANAYRAALIDYAKFKGQLTLVPTPDPRRQGGMPAPAGKEYADEEDRVAKFLAGDIIVGDADLERIFNLRPMAQRDPNRTIERWTGLNPSSHYSFDKNGTPGARSNGPGVVAVGGDNRSPMGYQFRNPDLNLPNAGCQTCGNQKR